MFKRYYDDLSGLVEPNKVLVIYGARRVGKTTLLNRYLKSCKKKYLQVNGDDLSVQEVLSSKNIELIRDFCHGFELVAIDEAQLIPEIGSGLKIMADYVEGIEIIATGSSSFDLANRVGEPLVGRQRIITMYPFAQLELVEEVNKFTLKSNLEKYLIYGGYPDVLSQERVPEKIRYLKEIANSYLYKDILAFDSIKNSSLLRKLTQKLAYHVGSELSSRGLANELSVDYKTIERYIDLLEKSFVVFSLGGFSRNLSNEITKKKKYYFYDLGVRNAVISNFNDLAARDDVGALWENFCIVERYKKQEYSDLFSNQYFWRTYAQAEIDYIEETGGHLYAYEFKWKQSKRQIKVPKAFAGAYSNHSFEVINPDNYLEFVL